MWFRWPCNSDIAADNDILQPTTPSKRLPNHMQMYAWPLDGVCEEAPSETLMHLHDLPRGVCFPVSKKKSDDECSHVLSDHRSPVGQDLLILKM